MAYVGYPFRVARRSHALLLHRLRKQAGEHPAVASRAVRAGFGISHDVATRALRRLARAGLIQVEGRPGSAYRVSILKPRKLEFEPPIKPVRIVAIHESSEAQPPNQSRNPTLIRYPTLVRVGTYAGERAPYPSYNYYVLLLHPSLSVPSLRISGNRREPKMALSRKDEAFMRQWVIPEEDRPKWQRWDGGYRWFRSPNVIPLERYRRRKQENDRQDCRRIPPLL